MLTANRYSLRTSKQTKSLIISDSLLPKRRAALQWLTICTYSWGYPTEIRCRKPQGRSMPSESI